MNAIALISNVENASKKEGPSVACKNERRIDYWDNEATRMDEKIDGAEVVPGTGFFVKLRPAYRVSDLISGQSLLSSAFDLCDFKVPAGIIDNQYASLSFRLFFKELLFADGSVLMYSDRDGRRLDDVDKKFDRVVMRDQPFAFNKTIIQETPKMLFEESSNSHSKDMRFMCMYLDEWGIGEYIIVDCILRKKENIFAYKAVKRSEINPNNLHNAKRNLVSLFSLAKSLQDGFYQRRLRQQI